MPKIITETYIEAPVERVFDLARSIDLHIATTGNTEERAIAGRTSGLIGHKETVIWEARHLGVKQRLESKITAFEYPLSFEDTMQEGAFSNLRHVHSFEKTKTER